jgi:hypothetical protein
MMFGDFEKQAIYDPDQKGNLFISSQFNQVPHFSLRVNCRNTPRVAELVHLLGGLSPGYTRIRRPDNNLEPQIIAYKNNNDQLVALEKVLWSLLHEGILPNEITILSMKNDQECITTKLSKGWGNKLVNLKLVTIKKRIRFGTIHSFKGLEAPVIILSDIEQVGAPASAALFYVGITRCLDRLYILVNETARKEMLGILTKPKR